jgi:hypothetical protein
VLEVRVEDLDGIAGREAARAVQQLVGEAVGQGEQSDRLAAGVADAGAVEQAGDDPASSSRSAPTSRSSAGS